MILLETCRWISFPVYAAHLCPQLSAETGEDLSNGGDAETWSGRNGKMSGSLPNDNNNNNNNINNYNNADNDSDHLFWTELQSELYG